MRKEIDGRLVRVASVLVTLLMAASIGGIWAGTAASSEGPTTYTFEVCDEGWTPVSNSTIPVLSPAWERAAPGDESEMAFWLPDYIDMQDESLISPVHEAPGGEINVTYSVAHSTEATFDFLFVDWSVDGSSWENVKEYTGGSEGYPAFTIDSVTFSPPAGPFQVRFRFDSDDFFSSLTGDGESVAVDNVTMPGARPEGAECEGDPTAPPGTPTPTSTGPAGTAERDISLESSKKKVKKGKRVTLSGRVTSEVSSCTDNELVRLKARPKGGKFKMIGARTTNATGVYSFRVTVRKTREYVALAPASTGCERAVSGMKVVRATR